MLGEEQSDADGAGGSGDEPRIKACLSGRPPLGGQTWGAGPKGARAPQRCLRLGRGGLGLCGAQALAHSKSLSHSRARPAVPLPQGCPHPCPGVGIPTPLIPGAHQAGGPPPTANITRAKQPPQFPWSQCAALTLSRRLPLLNCANEMTLIKAIAPQLGDGCCRLSGAPQPQPCPSTGQDKGPCSRDAVPEPALGDMV